ncbi:polysaccharide deacetylase family protein [Xanthobacter sp. 126]|uniref:polysaccharide deacetylase family protein n=1 Tax=Xanthobacter sp. 126 TaxID=1131814 RepID=UPI00045EABAF|nr:polysaccharide deacetylase family protein [Xanthobacter sp. 126]
MKPLLIVTGFVAAAAVGAGMAISPLLSAKDDGPATTQSISQPANPAAGQAAQGKGATAAQKSAAASAQPVPAPAPEPAAPPPVTPRKNYTYKSFDVDGSYIAMTFDDGPNPETTPRLLQILRERNIKVTFFVLGNMVAKHPEVLKMIADEGHEIGSHSWSHPQLTRISQAAVDKELGNTSEAIVQVTGKRPIYLRPPYGSMKPSLRSYIEDKYGLTIVNWSVDPNDWKNRNSQAVHDAIMAQVKPGAIVLSHDIYATTVDAMPRILDELAAKGYKFATLSQMVAMDKPLKVALATPGTAAAKKPKPAGAKPDAAKPAGTSKPAAAAPKPAASPAPARSAGVY